MVSWVCAMLVQCAASIVLADLTNPAQTPPALVTGPQMIAGHRQIPWVVGAHPHEKLALVPAHLHSSMVLRGGADESETRVECSNAVDDEPSVGEAASSKAPVEPMGAKEREMGADQQTVAQVDGSDGDEAFSVGAASGASAAPESCLDGASPLRPGSIRADDSFAEITAEKGIGGAAEASDEVTGEMEDDEDVVECKFERIGDTNGVFYYLGQQKCAKSTNGSDTQALNWHSAIPPAAGLGMQGGPPRPRRFQNPALTGRVQIKTGPQKIMCCSKFKGHIACPEEVSQFAAALEVELAAAQQVQLAVARYIVCPEEVSSPPKTLTHTTPSLFLPFSLTVTP